MWKDTLLGKQYFHYSDEGLIAELDASGSVTQSYGFGTGNLWATDPVYTRANGEYYFYHNDHLGTPQQLSDISGAKVWGAEYKAFGEAAVSTELIEQNLRFPGQRYDVETGLHQNYFRDYEPGLGRYVQSDPIGLEGGFNVYIYGADNPIFQIDPLGLARIKLGGNRYDVHKNDLDPWPSTPHGHDYENNTVIDKDGNVYNKTTKNRVGKLPKKLRLKWTKFIKFGGPIGFIGGVLIEKIVNEYSEDADYCAI